MEVKITECPRDAMQGLHTFIPTKAKIDYINSLLKVGFDVIDFGSFVSPRAIPQMRDTEEVVRGLKMEGTSSKLLAIIGNIRGAETGCSFEEITYLGYPHSISDGFLRKNINSDIESSRQTVEELMKLCTKNDKELVIYLSMAFGNPYGEEWNEELILEEVDRLNKAGVRYVAMSDTIGAGSPDSIGSLFSRIIPEFPEIEFSLHLHTTIENWYEKVDAAFKQGCHSFDGVLNGLGGCPMADHELVGNLYTGFILEYMRKNNIPLKIDRTAFENAIGKSITTFALTGIDTSGLDIND